MLASCALLTVKVQTCCPMRAWLTHDLEEWVLGGRRAHPPRQEHWPVREGYDW